MKTRLSLIITTGLAIFSMFFGAGNLMFPIKVGLNAGNQTILAMCGFMITAILLPALGLIAMILFDGNYYKFFKRVGEIPGELMIFACMLVIGPVIAMPRITTLSYTMIAPFIPNISLWLFSILFLGFTFLATYRENKIIDLLGWIISPVLLLSLIIIITVGIINGDTQTITSADTISLLLSNIKYGYQTLDVLGGIFFASIAINILKSKFKQQNESTQTNKLAIIGGISSIIGTSLLGIIYFGLGLLGSLFGAGLESANEGELFSAVSFRIIGQHGAFLIATAVLMACFSTIIALAAIVSEYLQNTIFQRKINYVHALIIVLTLAFIPANFGLGPILSFSAPLIEIGYPCIIVLMCANIFYKLFGIRLVKIPVLLTLLFSIYIYFN